MLIFRGLTDKDEKMRKETRENIRKELEGLSSSLRGPDGNSGFSLPDNYFESLPVNIQTRLKDERSSGPSVFSVFYYSRMVRAAAVFLLLIGIAFGFYMIRSGEYGTYSEYAGTYVDLEYFTDQSYLDHTLLYDMVFESDLTADEILYEFEIDAVLWDYDDEYLEILLEDSRYYGIESSYLISSLDLNFN